LTKNKQIKIGEATAEQLRAHAELNLGIDGIPAGETAPQIQARIRAVSDKDVIEVADEEPKARRAGAAVAKSAGNITVEIELQEGAGGAEPVFLSVNGSAMVVARGVPSPIPPSYFEVLQRAKKTVFSQIGGKGPLIPREVPQYPYKVLHA
jgi:hypothetical protein